jgi:hypothetical protein
MTEDIARFYDALSDLIKTFEQKNIAFKITYDLDSEIIKIYGERSNALIRAKAGLDEVAELSYDTAEHHPYWNLLYDGSQILKIVLEKWNENLTEDELKEIWWYAEKIKDATTNVSNKHHH